MEFKNQNPIKFEFMQDEMEKIMFFISNIIIEEKEFSRMKEQIKNDLQHKINIHKERGEWL